MISVVVNVLTLMVAIAGIALILRKLSRMESRLRMDEQTLEQKLDKLAADVTTAVSAQQAATADLKAQIAALQAGQPVSQEQLDNLGAKIDAIDAALAPLVPEV